MQPQKTAADTKLDMPPDALWVFGGDLFVGNRRTLAKADIADGLEAALARVFARGPTPQQCSHIRAAARRSRGGDDALANMQLAMAGLSRVHHLHK